MEKGKNKKGIHEGGITDVSDYGKKKHKNKKAAGHGEEKTGTQSSEDQSSDSEVANRSDASGEEFEREDTEGKHKREAGTGEKKATREDVSKSLAQNAHGSDTSTSRSQKSRGGKHDNDDDD